jgi:DNA-binding SARP family transcriptional activator/tetratricopeptide (TPR) repeat protein
MLFTVLGPVGFVLDGRHFSVPRAQTRGQLGLLCLRPGRSVSYEALAEGIWGGAPPATARNQVHGAMHVIRERLAAAGAPDVLAGGTFGYRLEVPPEQVDAGRFEGGVRRAREVGPADPAAAIDLLRSALALWQGESLAAASGGYVDAARAGLAQRWLVATEELAELELRVDRADLVVAELAPLVAEHPLRERLHLLLMRALRLTDRRADALAVYRGYRRRLVEQEGLDPGAEITALMEQLLRHQPTPPARPEPARPEPARPVPDRRGPAGNVPAQLPADVVGFSGRTAELALLDRLLDSQWRGDRPSAVCAVVGPGGIGKTALAVHWGHRVAGRFPDGALYVDLAGGGLGQPLDPGVALERWLLALGLAADRIPSGTAARTAALRTELAGRRMLLVLDNADSGAQVRPLLPGAGPSAVVITSRRRLDALAVTSGAVLVDLDRLPDADAAALVRTTVPAAAIAAADEQVAALVRMCDGFPLALRIAAARLSGTRPLPFPALLAALADEDRRLQELAIGPAGDELAVAASLCASYAQLSDAAQQVFRAIGVHFGPRPAVAAIGATAGLAAGETRAALDELADAHLIQPVGKASLPDTGGDRFTTHDLIRLYARDRAGKDPAELLAAAGRALDFYRAAAHAADLLLRPAGPHVGTDLPTGPPPSFGTEDDGLRWLDAEAENVVAAVRHGLPVAPGIAWRLCASLAVWLMRRAPRSTWIDLNNLAIAAAAAEGHLAGEALLANGLGIAHALTRDVEPATDAFERAHRLRLALGEPRAAAIALVNLGALLADTGDPAEAIGRLTAARDLLAGSGDDRDLCGVEYNLGFACQRAGRSAEALDWFGRARTTANAVGYVTIAGHAELGIAQVHENDGDLADAATHYARALPALRVAMDKVQLAWAAHGLARVHAALGRPEIARANLHAARELYEELGDPAADTVIAQLAELDADPATCA